MQYLRNALNYFLIGELIRLTYMNVNSNVTNVHKKTTAMHSFYLDIVVVSPQGCLCPLIHISIACSVTHASSFAHKKKHVIK